MRAARFVRWRDGFLGFWGALGEACRPKRTVVDGRGAAVVMYLTATLGR